MNFELRAGTPEHQLVVEALLARIRLSENAVQKKYPAWKKADAEFQMTMPEKDVDALRRAQRESGIPQYTTLQIPYTYSLMLTAHTYYSSVLLGRSPVWQYQGTNGESEMNVRAVEALMDYQMNNGLQLPPLYIWLHDATKYGAGILYDWWDDEVFHVSELEEVPEMIMGLPIPGRMKQQRRVREIKGYCGNRLLNVSPYDALPDPRVPLNKVQDGEFFGRRIRLGWNDYIKGVLAGKYFNRPYVEAHLKDNAGSSSNLATFVAHRADWETIGENGASHPKSSLVGQMPGVEMVVELIPREWKLGPSEHPEKWVLTILDERVIIGARPLGSYHNKFPVGILETEIEGYNLVKRGMPEIGRSLNDVMTWLVNSHFYSVRKTLNGSLIYDPSKVVAQDLLSNRPGDRIRLSPAAYGTDPRMAIHQLAGGADVTVNHLRDSEIIGAMLQRVLGVSDASTGAISPQSRRTATEIRTSSAGAVTRQKTVTEYMGAAAFSPLASRMLQNSQQLMQGEKKLMIAGDQVANPGTFINVTPEIIAGNYQYVAVDGSLPVDKFAIVSMWNQLLAQMQKFPQVMAEYNVGEVFAWVAQMAGMKNIKQFRLQTLQPGAQPDPNGMVMNGQQTGLQQPGSPGSAFSGPRGVTGGGADGNPVIPLSPQIAGMGRAL